MAPPAVKKASLHEESDPDAGAVMYCISFYTEYQAFHNDLNETVSKTEKGKRELPPAERLSVVEHKAVIQPPSETVHHKPVFQSLHDVKITHKLTINFRNMPVCPCRNGATDDFLFNS